MAKNKKKAPKASKRSSADENGITIDLDKLMVPGAIVVAALMISISVFLGIRSIGDTVIGSPKTTPTVAPTRSIISGTGTASISDSPVLGDKTTATLAIIEFSDYECPASKYHYTQTYDQVIEQYVTSGQAIYVYRNFIAVPSHNPAATLDATAAMCVQKLAGDTKYYEYHDYLFTATGSNGVGVTGGKDTLINQAVTIGIDQNAFTACLDDQTIADKIARDQADGTAAGQSGTPGFLIGKLQADGTVDGYVVSGAIPIASFQSVINLVLSE